MDESVSSAGLWRKMAEFMLTGQPLHEQESASDLDKALDLLQPPAAFHKRLRAALANAVDRMNLTSPEPAVIVRLFVAARDILRDNAHASPAQAPPPPPCWGFFLVEKRVGASRRRHPEGTRLWARASRRLDPTVAHTPVRPHLIEIFCYQEGDGGAED